MHVVFYEDLFLYTQLEESAIKTEAVVKLEELKNEMEEVCICAHVTCSILQQHLCMK